MNVEVGPGYIAECDTRTARAGTFAMRAGRQQRLPALGQARMPGTDLLECSGLHECLSAKTRPATARTRRTQEPPGLQSPKTALQRVCRLKERRLNPEPGLDREAWRRRRPCLRRCTKWRSRREWR